MPGLNAKGWGLGEAAFVQLYLADMACFGAVNEAYRARFPAVEPPARACVEALLAPGCPLAVDIVVPAKGELKMGYSAGQNINRSSYSQQLHPFLINYP